MTAYLLGTCVVIDHLRDRHEAIRFMRRQGVRPAVSATTAAELLPGVRNSAEEHQIEALCARLLIHHIDLEIARLGGSYCRQYRHSHGVQIADALIAATARIHEARLVTRNVRALSDAGRRRRALLPELKSGRGDAGCSAVARFLARELCRGALLVKLRC